MSAADVNAASVLRALGNLGYGRPSTTVSTEDVAIYLDAPEAVVAAELEHLQRDRKVRRRSHRGITSWEPWK